MTESPRDILRALYDAMVDAALPENCLAPHLPVPPDGNIIVLAAGKAAGSMAAAAEAHYLDRIGLAPERIGGLAVTRYGYARLTRRIKVLEAAHPVPDEAGIAATEETLALAGTAGPDDLVLVLLSGGGSALWIAPVAGIGLETKQTLTRDLLASGAGIGEINTVRRHLSRIKGGRLAAAAYPAQVLTLAISDVPGDHPAAIASGPTVGDPTTLADARTILDGYGIAPGPEIAAALRAADNETPAPGDERLRAASYRMVASPAMALAACESLARQYGYDVELLGDDLEDDARDLAAGHAERSLAAADDGRRVAILSGGEAVVRLRGRGRGGPNQEFALALALALGGRPGIWGLGADTDGTDGGGGAADDPAGAFVGPDTLKRAADVGLDADSFLENNDSTSFFERLGDLLVVGPTYTNVNDFRAVIVDITAD